MPVAGPSNLSLGSHSIIDLTAASPPLGRAGSNSSANRTGLSLPNRGIGGGDRYGEHNGVNQPRPVRRSPEARRAPIRRTDAHQGAVNDDVLVLSSGSEDEGPLPARAPVRAVRFAPAPAIVDDDVQIVGEAGPARRAGPSVNLRPSTAQRLARLQQERAPAANPPALADQGQSANQIRRESDQIRRQFAQDYRARLHRLEGPRARPPAIDPPGVPPPPVPRVPPPPRPNEAGRAARENWRHRYLADVGLDFGAFRLGGFGGGPLADDDDYAPNLHELHNEHQLRLADLIHLLGGGGPAPGLHGVMPAGGGGFWGGAAKIKAGKKYGVRLSHPRRVEPNFSRDIVRGDSDDEDGLPPAPSDTLTTTTTTSGHASKKRKATAPSAAVVELEPVCAACATPLLLAQTGMRRIWALKCGHVVCGACVGEARMRCEARKAGSQWRSGGVLVVDSDDEDEAGKEDADVDGPQDGVTDLAGRKAASRQSKGQGKGKSMKKNLVPPSKGKRKADSFEVATDPDWTACPVASCSGEGTDLLAPEGDYSGAFELFV